MGNDSDLVAAGATKSTRANYCQFALNRKQLDEVFANTASDVGAIQLDLDDHPAADQVQTAREPQNCRQFC